MVKYYFIESNNFCGYKKLSCEYSFSAAEGKKWLLEDHPGAKIKLVKKKDVVNMEKFNSIRKLVDCIKEAQAKTNTNDMLSGN